MGRTISITELNDTKVLDRYAKKQAKKAKKYQKVKEAKQK